VSRSSPTTILKARLREEQFLAREFLKDREKLTREVRRLTKELADLKRRIRIARWYTRRIATGSFVGGAMAMAAAEVLDLKKPVSRSFRVFK